MSEEPTPKPVSSEWQHANWVSILGKWAWVVIMINAIIGIISSIGAIIVSMPLWIYGFFPGTSIYWIVGSVIAIFISFAIIRPKFSNPCGEKDWEALYSWTLNLGGTQVPWMFIWGLILEIFGWYGWGGLFVLIPAIMLIWFGPRKYEW